MTLSQEETPTQGISLPVVPMVAIGHWVTGSQSFLIDLYRYVN